MNSFGIAAAIIAGALGGGVPAFGGGVLLCNEFGCRSSPYFPPVPVPVGPPVVYSPAPHGGPARAFNPPVVYGVPLAPSPVLPPPTRRDLRLPDFPPEAYRAPPAPPLRADPPPRRRAPDADGESIERDIMAFCDAHPDEQFCGRLGEYLRKHPDRAPR